MMENFAWNFQFDSCQVWLRSGLTAVKSDCGQIRQLSANACRNMNFNSLVRHDFLQLNSLTSFFHFLVKNSLPKNEFYLSPPWFFTTHFLVRISLPKSEKMKSRNLAVKNHGGLRNWNSHIRQALADSCLIWQQSDLTAVRPDSSQAIWSSNSKYSNTYLDKNSFQSHYRTCEGYPTSS